MEPRLLTRLLAVLAAYLLGSFPTALVYSRLRGKDIRALGDGNMGAANTKRNYGFRAGLLVGVLDVLKGLAAVLLAQAVRAPLEWQLAAGAAAILGHDFPIWAGFKGGQGLAATAGVFIGLSPLPALAGLGIYGLVYLLTRNANLGAGLGAGLVALYTWLSGEPLIVVGFLVAALLFIPFKKWLDRPRRERIKAQG